MEALPSMASKGNMEAEPVHGEDEEGGAEDIPQRLPRRLRRPPRRLPRRLHGGSHGGSNGGSLGDTLGAPLDVPLDGSGDGGGPGPARPKKAKKTRNLSTTYTSPRETTPTRRLTRPRAPTPPTGGCAPLAHKPRVA